MKRLCFFLFVLFFISNCAKVSEKPPIPQTLEKYKKEVSIKKEETVEEEKKKRIIEEITLPKYKKEEKIIEPEEKLEPEKIKLPDEKVIINALNVPLFDFLLYVFGEVLKVPFIMDHEISNISTPLTLRTPEPVPSKQALEMIVEILKKIGINVSTKAGALYISKPKETLSTSPPTRVFVGEDIALSSQNIMHIIPLKYVKAQDIVPFISETYKGSIIVKVFPKENAIALTGQGIQIRNILDFIKAVDIPYMSDKKVFLIRLLYWKSEDFIKQISEIFQGIGIPVAKSQNEPGIYFIPIKYLNSVLAICPDENSSKILQDWISKIDTPESVGTEEKVFIYSPLYIRAVDLVEAVKNLFTGSHISSTQTSPPPQTDKKTVETTPSLTKQIFSAESLKITADDKRNTVITITTPSNYKMLLELFKQIDKPTRQVLIETVIAEVTLKDDLRYGVEWFIRNKMAEGTYTIQTLEKLGVSTTSGLVYQFVTDSEKFKLLINLLAQKNLINILSTPRLLVLDNEEATINIGVDVPVVTGEVTTSTVTTAGEVGIVRSIQYRSTGIILKVKPTINTAGLLTLNITQEVSQAQTNIISAIESPIILTRKINTVITAPSEHTIVLGGLIEENKSLTETKVPLLGDIPGIGNLFKSVSEGVSKTELIIMLTPKILTTVDELLNIAEELKKEFFKK
uniref:Type II secretion system protein GspD n=1 Tax=Thermodesulfobacterium geofontis TaxID=1295609 RepID=A0A7V5XHD6_9BACT